MPWGPAVTDSVRLAGADTSLGGPAASVGPAPAKRSGWEQGGLGCDGKVPEPWPTVSGITPRSGCCVCVWGVPLRCHVPPGVGMHAELVCKHCEMVRRVVRGVIR